MLWKAMGAALLALATVQAGAAGLSGESRQLHDWVLKARDHHGRPFAIVDKKSAHIYVFDRTGKLQGESTVLIGQAKGDDSAPDVGEHAQQGAVPFEERTTPAGRCTAEPGVNATGENIIWVEYATAFAIHRLQPGTAEAARKIRFASRDPEEHRVSYGCVVVPVKFYLDVVTRWLGKSKSVVYVLPEQSSAAGLFNSL